MKYYCEIIDRQNGAVFYRGQGSSCRVAAMRAIEQLIEGSNLPRRFDQFTITVGPVGGKGTERKPAREFDAETKRELQAFDQGVKRALSAPQFPKRGGV